MEIKETKQTNIHAQTPGFAPISDEEADRIIGGRDPHNAGICVGVGFACNERGGIKFGVCYLYGLAGGGWTFIP